MANARRISWIARCFIWFGLLVYSAAIVNPLRVLRGAPPQLPGESDPVMAASQTIILGFVLICLVGRWSRIRPLFRFVIPYLLIIMICAASSLWSDYPFPSFRRSVTLAICILFGVCCYDLLGLERLISGIGRLAVILAVLSVIVYFAIPDIGHDPEIQYGNAMRGVFSQKNQMAEFLVLAISCFSYRLITHREIRTFAWSVPLLYGCLVLSFSATSLVTATLVLAMAGFLSLSGQPRIRLVYGYFLMTAGVILAAAMFVYPDTMLGAIGRDPSLTGRLPLWSVVVDKISERPLLGYGYSGFWNASSPEVQDIWKTLRWRPPDSHNGYLDIMLQIGMVGIIVYIWAWSRTIYLALRAQHTRTLPEASWILLFMLINVLVNIDEGPLPWADMFTMLMPAAMIAVGRWHVEFCASADKVRWRNISNDPVIASLSDMSVKARHRG